MVAADQLPPADPPAAERIPGGLLFRDVEFARPLGFRPLLLEVRVPTVPGPAPLVVHVYGGGFATGSHQSDALGACLIERLLPEGFAVASVQYRHSREAPFPAQLHDVKAAVRWLRHHSGVLGLDPIRFAAWGASSGGHLSTMLAVTSSGSALEGTVGLCGPSSAVRAAIAWSAPVNIARLPPPPVDSPFHAMRVDPHDWLLGGPVHQHPDRAAAASSSTHVSAGAAPLMVLHGDLDTGIPIDQAEEIVEAYQRAGAAIEYDRVPGAGHFFDPAIRDQKVTVGMTFLHDQLT